MEPELLTVPEVAKLLSVSVRHVAWLTSRGVLPVIRLGRSVRYRRAAIMAKMERLEKQQAS